MGSGWVQYARLAEKALLSIMTVIIARTAGQRWMQRGKTMENNDAQKEMELLFRLTKALEKAEDVIQKQDKMLENIVLKTIEILAKEIRKN